MISLFETLNNGKETLRKAEIPEPDLDAWYLLSHCLNISRAEFWLRKETEILPDKYKEFMELIQERVLRKPLQYIIGEQEFMGLSFAVNADVLIPRQDTELLVEEVLKVVEGKKVLDLCTGSGCIIVSLAKLAELSLAMGTDVSEAALIMATRNARSHEVEVIFRQSDIWNEVEERFDIIVSNPPYIESDEVEKLMPEVKDFEPLTALDGKRDGLFFYREIIKKVDQHLMDGGRIYFEIGYNQGNEVRELLADKGFRNINIIKDLAGLDRVVCAEWEMVGRNKNRV